MKKRGSYEFEVTDSGDIINNNQNVELLRKLWLDSEIISRRFGPGNRGDFDHGAWHVSCHLAGAGCVRKRTNGSIFWLEISHNSSNDFYYPTLTIRENNDITVHDLDSPEAKRILNNSVLLGFIEGTSEGRISAKNVQDSSSRFNGWPRQEFNKNPGEQGDGGKVWEHWCTTRDIRQSSEIGSSVLSAFISLVSAAGDKFVPTVARGRTTHNHPDHLRGMVKAGFTSIDSARWNITPEAISNDISLILQTATPEASLAAAEQLDWSDSPKYYMFSRRIRSWNIDDLP
jgi:hypothetical protein